MSDLLRAIVLGVVQGLTEFLPISSSGHLEILNQLMGSNGAIDSDLLMIVIAHLGTAFSILYVFRSEVIGIIKNLFNTSTEGKLAWKIVISMIPAVVIGLLFETQIEALFAGSIIYVGMALIITGLVLFITPALKTNREIGFKNSLLIGIAQAVAIIPGISRSGMTIATALFLGAGREQAARFSFLMVLPIIFGKVILDVYSGQLIVDQASIAPVLGTLLTSFLVGVWACKWMVSLVRQHRLKYFAYYCFILGLATIVLFQYA